MLCAADDDDDDDDVDDDDNAGPLDSIDANPGALNPCWCKINQNHQWLRPFPSHMCAKRQNAITRQSKIH